MKYFFIIFFVCFFSKLCIAEVGKETGLKIPRFISIKSSEANIRVGPSKNYPIILRYLKKNFPLKIIEEHEDWRKVQDYEENIGWIHKSLISGKRTGLLSNKNNNFIEVFNTINGNIIGKIGNNNIVFLNKCKMNWCYVLINNQSGWINKNNIWGVKEEELLNINIFQKFLDFYWLSVIYLKKNLNFI